MKSIVVIVSILFLNPIVSFSQKPSSKFGDVSIEELKMNDYPKDSSAAAIILFDKGESYLGNDLTVEFKRHVRIKFFTNEEIDQWSVKTIYLAHNEDAISKLKASTYNLENGRIDVAQMEEASIFRTKFNRYLDQLKFTFPKVKKGSIVEYSYILRTTANLLPSWQFQHSIPAVRSEYAVSIPKSFTFRKDLQGFLQYDEHYQKNGGAVEQWAMNDVPAFKEEPFITTPQNYISKLNFYLFEVAVPGRPSRKFNRSWQSIVKDLDDDLDFGVQIRTSGFLKRIVESITSGIADDEKKVTAIFDYVKSNVAWSGFTDMIPDQSFKKVLDEKKGSSSEINLLLVSMLLKGGLQAYPVLLSTRTHGAINTFFPRLNQFNDVICLVMTGGKEILLDGTDRHLPLNALPERCLNGEGLVVSIDSMRWIPLVSARSRTVVNIEFVLGITGELKGKVIIARDGLDGSAMRKILSELGEEKYRATFRAKKNWDIESSNFENLDDPSRSSKETHEFKLEDHAQVSGDAIYLNPYVIEKVEENKFKSTERKYPVDFSTPFDRVYMAKIRIPDGYFVEELPKPKVLLLPENGGKFVYSATTQGGLINFVSQFIINRSVFGVEEYSALREFYNLLVAKQSEQIVLKKINTEK